MGNTRCYCHIDKKAHATRSKICGRKAKGEVTWSQKREITREREKRGEERGGGEGGNDLADVAVRFDAHEV